jgi:hypothetical protein
MLNLDINIMAINYKRKDGNMDELRERIYSWSIDLIKEGKCYEGIFLMLSTWNFASFRYHMKTFNLSKFQKVFDKLPFKKYQQLKFEEIKLTNNSIKDEIQQIYSTLSEFKGIGSVGATKIMHFMCPDTFVMWDRNIRISYKYGISSQDYYDYLVEMQNKYLNKHFKGLNKTVSIPRAIDIYNFDKFNS